MKHLLLVSLLGFFSLSLCAQNCAQTTFPDPPTNLNANDCIGLDQGPNGDWGNWLVWTPPPGATACLVAGNLASNPNDILLRVGDLNTNGAPTGIFIPVQYMPGTIFSLYRFKVTCGCSVDPVNTSPFSEYHYFGNMICL